jgi:hypothetical protein
MSAGVIRIEWPDSAQLAQLVEHDIAYTVNGEDLVVHLVNGRDLVLNPGNVLEIET